jgi:hypothetical protein
MLPNRSIGIGPYTQPGGWLSTFCIDGDGDKIDAWLRDQFETPSGGAVAYEAITSKLFLSFATFAHVRADGPPDAAHGTVPERDCALWALARRKGHSMLDMHWIPLFVFVDQGSAMSTGREIYGFPKQIGQFDTPARKPPSAGPFALSATVLDPFAPETQARTAPIFEVETDPKATGGLGEVLTDAEALAGRVTERLRGAADRVSGDWLTSMLGGRSLLFDLPVKMTFLKQFPDTADPSRAAFQSIVEADARTLKVRGGGWTSEEYRVRVHSYDSHPFAEALGVAPGWHEAGHALWADFDFTMELGKDVWRA